MKSGKTHKDKCCMESLHGKEKKHDAVTKNREGLLETGSPGKASVKIWCVNGVA